MNFESVTPHPLDEENEYGGIVISPASELGKELRKWEQHHTYLVPPGTHPGNPYVFREFPKMLYKAQKQRNGQYACMLPAPVSYDYERADAYERAVLIKESFDKSCYRIVADETAERLAKGQGWAETIPAALELAEAHERAIADAAAEAAYAAQRMTEQARAELKAADAATHAHVVDVAPTLKRGRAAKGLQPVTE